VSLILRIVRVGLTAAVIAGVVGYGLERARFGPTDQAALSRVEAELRQRFDASAATLGTIAAQIAALPDAGRPAPRDQAALKRLFDAVSAALPEDEAGRTGITIYDAVGAPLAWGGRVTELGKERVLGPPTLIVAPFPLGPGLIRIEAVTRNGIRVATVVVEQMLGTAHGAPGLSDTFAMTTSIAPVTLRVRAGGARGQSQPFRFTVPARDGGFALEAEVSPGDLAAARTRWRAATRAAVLSVLAITLLFCSGPLMDMRRQRRDAGDGLGPQAIAGAELGAERSQLPGVGEAAVPEQVGHLLEGPVGDLVDQETAPVDEASPLAVHLADLGLGRDHSLETGTELTRHLA